MRELGINVVAHLPRAAALVSRSLRGRGRARPDHVAVGEAHRVSRQSESARDEIVRVGPQRRSPRTPGIPRSSVISLATKSPSTMVRWLGVRRVTEFVETSHPGRARS